jgi:hypothetical protein
MIIRPPDFDDSNADPPSQQADRIEAVIAVASDGVRAIQRGLEIKRDHPGGRIIDLVRSDPFDIGADSKESSVGGFLVDNIIPPPSERRSR